MANIKGNGEPTRKTVGAMGDIYTNTTTGKQYECVFAYRDNQGNEFDCQWKELPETSEIEMESVIEEPAVETVEESVIEEPAVETPEETTEEILAEEEAGETPEKPARKTSNRKRTNYTSYAKKTEN